MNPNPVDKRLARRAFEQAAGDYDRVAVLQQEIARRMVDRLDYIRLSPRVMADVGAGTGFSTELLQRRYPEAQVLALDFALVQDAIQVGDGVITSGLGGVFPKGLVVGYVRSVRRGASRGKPR